MLLVWGPERVQKMQAGSGCEWNPLWFTSISPHAGLCLSQPHCVLFSLGDLEVSNSAIQIHCICHTLSFSPPVSPLLLLMPPYSSFLLRLSLFPSSFLLPRSHLCQFFLSFVYLVCFFLLPSITILNLPDHISHMVILVSFFFPLLIFSLSVFLLFFSSSLPLLPDLNFYYHLLIYLIFFVLAFFHLKTILHSQCSTIFPCPLNYCPVCIHHPTNICLISCFLYLLHPPNFSIFLCQGIKWCCSVRIGIGTDKSLMIQIP